MHLKKVLHTLIAIVLLTSTYGNAQSNRKDIDLNDNWKFHFAYDVRKKPTIEMVKLPHTWNAMEAKEGKMNYTRDAAIYERTIDGKSLEKTKRFFLMFDGVNSYAQVFINNHFVGEHKGGYTKFCIEITDEINFGDSNKLTVWVSNAMRPDILPLTGDFNIFGGIHRPIHLIETDQNCISPIDNASSGVYITPKIESDSKGLVTIKTILSLKNNQNTSSKTLKISILDQQKNIVATTSQDISNQEQTITCSTYVNNPVRWDGIKNPYLYSCHVQLFQNGKAIDEVNEHLGFRNYHVSSDSGVILNGHYQNLYGFGFHEDLEGKGSALSQADLAQDMQLVKESGATSLRLTHYPHSQYVYDFADKNGIVLWSEIPLVGPGGYTGAGYYNNPELQKHAIQILKEMIYQNYNHPSVFFWGLFNELKMDYDNPVPFIKILDSIAHTVDPSRLTTAATFLPDGDISHITDVVAWNKYYGWYGGDFSDIATWADKNHQSNPNMKFSVSEYGAGASVKDHDNNAKAPDPDSKWHPEEWQTAFHEAHWKYLKQRPFVWGKYIWALTDFASSIRTEGDHNGINDKGLITYDRKTKKDAFYFYKANWNPEPMLYISERRFIQRKDKNVAIKVFANIPNITLSVNGVKINTQTPDENKTIIWSHVPLKKGKNTIEISANNGGINYHDSCTWTY